jgi:hypothetical protein
MTIDDLFQIRTAAVRTLTARAGAEAEHALMMSKATKSTAIVLVLGIFISFKFYAIGSWRRQGDGQLSTAPMKRQPRFSGQLPPIV